MLSQMVWLGLSQDTRKKISILLEIPRSGATEVVDGRVVSDGHTPLDLSTVTLESLQAFMLSDEEDFYKLFNILVARVEAPMEEIGVKVIPPALADIVPATENVVIDEPVPTTTNPVSPEPKPPVAGTPRRERSKDKDKKK